MEDKMSISKFLGQMFTTYGTIVLIFIILCKAIGVNTQDYSSIYEYGDKALSIATLLQVLGLSFIISVAQNIFLTDAVIKNMSLIARVAIFLGTICCVVAVFAVVFGWFPINEPKAWIGFIVSFFACTVISVTFSLLGEKSQNKKMEEALRKYNDAK